MRDPNRFFGTRVFRYLKLGIRDLKAKLGRVSVLKVCPRGGMPNITLEITGSYKFWVGITGLKNLIGTLRHVLFANVSGRLILWLHTHHLLIMFPLRKTFLRVIRNKKKVYRNFVVIASNL